MQSSVYHHPDLLVFQPECGSNHSTSPQTSDSALYYYDIGWQQVLDYGHFTNSEKAYRRMYEFDPEFLVEPVSSPG